MKANALAAAITALALVALYAAWLALCFWLWTTRSAQ